jgi:S1-C subfamily serine protease
LALALVTGVAIGQSTLWSLFEGRADAAPAKPPRCGPAGPLCGPASADADVAAELAASAVPTAGAPTPVATATAEPAADEAREVDEAARLEPPRARSKTPHRAADEPVDEPAGPSLSRQEVARRALEWSAAIRGDGYYGAGMVIDKRGYVLTCHHVVKDMKSISVSFPDTGDLPARLVDYDEDLDLALLDVGVERPVAAPMASFVESRIGDEVLSVGSPRRMDFTVAWGIVSYVGRRMVGHYYLQTDLPTNGGNSGGPVVNGRGEVLGIMSFNLRQSQGLSFATPIDVAYERFAKHLKRDRLDLGSFHHWLQARADGPPVDAVRHDVQEQPNKGE